jgi:hypothetical protein
MSLARHRSVEFSWPFMLIAIGALVVGAALTVWGTRVLARRERDEETAAQLGMEIGAALAREPRLGTATILPVASLPAEGRPSLELTGRVPSPAMRELALVIARRELERRRPGMVVVDRLEVA